MPSRSSESDAHAKLSLRRALVLGAIHGPAELLPISSSAHVSAVPWLLGWDYHELDGELRKSFEVALHAGTAAALLIGLRDEVCDAVRTLRGRRLGLLALSFAPPALTGYLFHDEIEQRLGTPTTLAAALVAGAAVMALADRAPQIRRYDEAGATDGLLLGVAQACALVPGVSRAGATLAVARLRRFRREDAGRLSRQVALPVIAGAALLEGIRLSRRGLDPGTGLTLAAGAGASFATALASARFARRLERERPLLPYAAYRVALAAAILERNFRFGEGRSPGTCELPRRGAK